MEAGNLYGEPDINTPAGPEGQPSPAQWAATKAESLQMRAELEQVRAERNRLLDRQRKIMDLLGTQSADHLIHDLRNVLNERELLRTLTEGQFDD